MQQLSSDILEQQFGPTEIDVLEQDDETRTICTKVIASGQVLELSEVRFIAEGAAEFPDIHQEIVAGKSMGKAFAGHGVAFVRQVRSTYTRSLPDSLAKRFDAQGRATIVEVSVVVGPDKTPYADIVETYSPAVVWPLV